MFVPGTPYSQRHLRRIFDRAVEESELDRAWRVAAHLERVDLHRALALTTLLGRQGDDRYQECARRFLSRFVAEARPTLGQVKQVAEALDQIGRLQQLPAMREGADRALADLARRLSDQS
jgi:hypothetical protein